MKHALIKTTLSLMGILALSMPMTAFAQSSLLDVSVSDMSSTRIMLPTSNVSADGRMLIQVTNPTDQTVLFKVPELGISHPVEALSDRTFFIDGFTTDEGKIAYLLTDTQGTQLASGTLFDNMEIASVHDSRLTEIINYSTQYSAEADPEPQYYESSTTEVNRSAVRGYW
jgi:hypothetical protein